MAKIEITVPGERLVEDFTALVPQPTTPSTARAPDVGLVELSQVNPTVLVPGPPGPPGPRGSRWYTGVGDPTITGALFGDMYLDDVTGQIWTWNGVAWVNTGTDLSPDAIELLNKIKTVDGSGSGLDADTLDGQDGSYYLDWDNFTDKPSTFPPTLPIAESDVTNLVSDLASKAPIASPVFTGDPRAPTLAGTDNDTSIATTAFVKSIVATVPPFPEAPVDGLTYGRKNANWATIVGGAVIADAPPGGALQSGQLWWESDTGNTYIWYDDGNTQQWVQQNVVASQIAAVTYIGDAPPATADHGNCWWQSSTGKMFIYFDDGNTKQWVQVSGTQVPNGVVKISEGGDTGLISSPAGIDVALPDGFKLYELDLFDTVNGSAASMFARFSMDGGATYPITNHAWTFDYTTSVAASGSWAATGSAGNTATLMQIGVAVQIAGVANAGYCKIRIPRVAADVYPSIEYNGQQTSTSYIHFRGMGRYVGALGPPTHIRIGASTGTFRARSGWQLNGVR